MKLAQKGQTQSKQERRNKKYGYSLLVRKKNRERGAKKRQFSDNFRLVAYMPAKHVHKLFIEGDNTICKVKNGNYC